MVFVAQDCFEQFRLGSSYQSLDIDISRVYYKVSSEKFAQKSFDSYPVTEKFMFTFCRA